MKLKEEDLVVEAENQKASNVLRGLEIALGFAEENGYDVLVKRGPKPFSFDFVLVKSSTEGGGEAE